jgi:hypothetical protein
MEVSDEDKNGQPEGGYDWRRLLLGEGGARNGHASELDDKVNDGQQVGKRWSSLGFIIEPFCQVQLARGIKAKGVEWRLGKETPEMRVV